MQRQLHPQRLQPAPVHAPRALPLHCRALAEVLAACRFGSDSTLPLLSFLPSPLQRGEAAMDVDAADPSLAQLAPGPALSDAVAQRALFSLQASQLPASSSVYY